MIEERELPSKNSSLGRNLVAGEEVEEQIING
jgi:hypothetical protein